MHAIRAWSAGWLFPEQLRPCGLAMGLLPFWGSSVALDLSVEGIRATLRILNFSNE